MASVLFVFCIVALIYQLHGQTCDCFDTTLTQIYQPDGNTHTHITCYEYITTQDTSNPGCEPALEMSITFGINENDCFLNGLELADVITDTTPPTWSYIEADEVNFPGVQFNLDPNDPIVVICIDRANGHLSRSERRLDINQNTRCEQTFDSNPDFCESYNCDINPTCYCFDGPQLCADAPAEVGKMCVWNDHFQRCDATAYLTTTTSVPVTTTTVDVTTSNAPVIQSTTQGPARDTTMSGSTWDKSRDRE
eukprot:185740_1